MKFREKTYLITLVLFLLFFNTGIFSLAYYTYYNNTAAETKLCKEESHVIADSFAKDMERLNRGVESAIIMRSYCTHYGENGINLAFWQDDENYTQYGNLPEGIKIPVSGYSSIQKIGDKDYYVIGVPISNSNILLIYSKDVSYLSQDFHRLSAVYIVTSVCASVLLALFLFFILRKLSKPLEKLRNAASEIAQGNFNSRADENGKDEFSLLAADFNRMAEQVGNQMTELETIAKTKQNMLDNLAHEMRTPLTSIRGYAEYLRNANIDEKEKIEAIEFIISESERLKLIGERMLDEAFIRENKINIQQVNLGGLIFDISKSLSVKAANMGVALRINADDIYLDCDKLLIEQLITNLTDNSIKACKGNGEVIISCNKTEKETVICVSDNGIGMTKEQILHITEPFYRTDKSRSRDEGGTGLGLSLCEKIANAHGAKLHFESQINKGTKAFVTFTNS